MKKRLIIAIFFFLLILLLMNIEINYEKTKDERLQQEHIEKNSEKKENIIISNVEDRGYYTAAKAEPSYVLSEEEWYVKGMLSIPTKIPTGAHSYSMTQIWAMYYIPETAIERATTRELLDVVLDWPMAYFSLYNCPYDYYEFIEDKFNALDELLAREDCALVVVDEYDRDDFYRTGGQYTEEERYFAEDRIIKLETILSTDNCFYRLSDEERNKAANMVVEKMNDLQNYGFANKKTSAFVLTVRDRSLNGERGWYDYFMEEYKENTAYEKIRKIMENLEGSW